jgi:hypothetical protein
MQKEKKVKYAFDAPVIGIPVIGFPFPSLSFCHPPPWPPKAFTIWSHPFPAFFCLATVFLASTAMVRSLEEISFHVPMPAGLSSSTSLDTFAPPTFSSFLHILSSQCLLPTHSTLYLPLPVKNSSPLNLTLSPMPVLPNF